MDDIEKALTTKRRTPKFRAGDTVQAHVRVREGEKQRVQIFEGIVISRRGGGTNETFTVRKVVQGEGIERVFQLQSPGLAKIVVKKRGKVRRAKLYYLREKKGRAGRVEELFGPTAASEPKAEPPEKPEEPAPAKKEETKEAAPAQKK
jgi:large subunit ribosomal protein L19